MPQLRTEDGNELETESLPKDFEELVPLVIEAKVQLDPLEDDEAEIDPANFLDELRDYVREAFRLKKGAVPEVAFRDRGRIGFVSYWIFGSEPVSGNPVYLFVVRNDYVTELTCSEQAVAFRDAVTGDLHDRLLSPAQAALLEYCLNDYLPPPRPKR